MYQQWPCLIVITDAVQADKEGHEFSEPDNFLINTQLAKGNKWPETKTRLGNVAKANKKKNTKIQKTHAKYSLTILARARLAFVVFVVTVVAGDCVNLD